MAKSKITATWQPDGKGGLNLNFPGVLEPLKEGELEPSSTGASASPVDIVADPLYIVRKDGSTVEFHMGRGNRLALYTLVRNAIRNATTF